LARRAPQLRRVPVRRARVRGHRRRRVGAQPPARDHLGAERARALRGGLRAHGDGSLRPARALPRARAGRVVPAGGLPPPGAPLSRSPHAPAARARVALGIIAGFLPPAAVLGYSALTEGQVPVNVVGYTVFLFPLSIAYAVRKRDLFAIDALVQRGLYYTILSGLVTVVYLLLAALGT